MAKITSDQLRDEVSRFLNDNGDFGNVTIGTLRASVEKTLGLAAGELEPRKAELVELVKAKLAEQETQEAPTKKQRVDQAPSAPGAKEKKEKKVKKEEKKPKKDKKEKKSKKETVEEQDSPEAQEETAVETQKKEALEASAFEDEEGLEALPIEEVAEAVTAPPEPNEPTEPLGTAAPVKRLALLTGAEDGGIRFWEDGRCVHIFGGHKGAVYGLVVNWESLEAVSAGEDSSKLWNLKLGGCLRTMSDTPEGCLSVCADWDSAKAVVGCGDGTIRLWCLKSGDLLEKFPAHRGGVWALQGNFKESCLGSAGDEAVKIWDMKDWTCLYMTPGHAGGLMCISVNWSESQILAGSGSTANLQLWTCEESFSRSKKDAKSNAKARGEAVRYHGHQDVVPDLAVDWMTNTAVTGGWDANLIVWNLKTGIAMHTHECKFGRVRSIGVDFANSQVWCGSSNGNLHLMDLRSGLLQETLEGHGGAITAIKGNFGFRS